MNGITKIVVALLVFSLIVIIHELGHFLLAKKSGIMVTEFSLGMGPRLLSFQGKETRYSLKLFPIGGSCMMLGEDDANNDPRSFNSKGIWARIATIAGGPIFNFILAFVLAIFVIGVGGIDEAYITNVSEGFPAAEAGLQEGDLITHIGRDSVDISRDVDLYFQFKPLDEGQSIPIRYERDGQEYETTVSPVLYSRYMLGFYYTPDDTKAEITNLSPGYPLEIAGIEVGDVITAVDGVAIASGTALNEYFTSHPLSEEEVAFTYVRAGEEHTVQVVPRASQSYTLGLSYNGARSSTVTGLLDLVKFSYTEVKFWIKTTIGSLGQLITGQVSMDNIAGPVGIVTIIGDSYEAAAEVSVMAVFLQLAYMSILLSANLGVMNLLPIPALDGGRLVFLFIEAIRGKPVDPEKEGMVHMIGFIALMLLMVFVVFNDIINIIF